MNENTNKIISALPYKIKKEKNVDLIHSYLLKQSKQMRFISLLFFAVWLLYLTLYFDYSDVGIKSLSEFDSIVSLMQIILLPILSFMAFRMSKNKRLTKAEIKKQLEKQNIN